MARYADTSGYTAEENMLWERLIRAQGTVFRTAKGLPFTHVIRGNELFVSRREKSITRATVHRALQKMTEETITGSKQLGVFGASYLFPLLNAMKEEPYGRNDTMNEQTEKTYQDINAETIDRWIEEGWEWGKPINHETFLKARQGDWQVKLTPIKPVPKAWFGDLKGKKVLGLASGGAQQMPVFAALGAECTVLDYSPKQIESEIAVARREGYAIRAIRGDMTQPLPFEDGEFDLIFHPVSNCYVREVLPIWRECARVLKKGGALLAGMDNGLNYAFDTEEKTLAYTLPFDPLTNPEHKKLLEETDSGMQFSHGIGEQIGGQLMAGLTLKDVYDDLNGEGNLHDHGVPSFWATRAVKE